MATPNNIRDAISRLLGTAAEARSGSRQSGQRQEPSRNEQANFKFPTRSEGLPRIEGQSANSPVRNFQNSLIDRASPVPEEYQAQAERKDIALPRGEPDPSETPANAFLRSVTPRKGRDSVSPSQKDSTWVRPERQERQLTWEEYGELSNEAQAALDMQTALLRADEDGRRNLLTEYGVKETDFDKYLDGTAFLSYDELKNLSGAGARLNEINPQIRDYAKSGGVLTEVSRELFDKALTGKYGEDMMNMSSEDLEAALASLEDKERVERRKPGQTSTLTDGVIIDDLLLEQKGEELPRRAKTSQFVDSVDLEELMRDQADRRKGEESSSLNLTPAELIASHYRRNYNVSDWSKKRESTAGEREQSPWEAEQLRRQSDFYETAKARVAASLEEDLLSKYSKEDLDTFDSAISMMLDIERNPEGGLDGGLIRDDVDIISEQMGIDSDEFLDLIDYQYKILRGGGRDILEGDEEGNALSGSADDLFRFVMMRGR